MKKNQIYIYNTPKISFVSNNAGEISSDNEIKNMIIKSRLPTNIMTKKLQLDKIKKNEAESILTKKGIDNSMNKLNTKRTHISEDLNNNNEKEGKNIAIIYNQNKNQEINDINNNIKSRITRNQKHDKKKNKNIEIYDIDSMNEKMIDNNNKNNLKGKDNFYKNNLYKYKFNFFDRSERGLKEDLKNKEKNDEEIAKEKTNEIEKIYELITGYNIEQKIIYDNLKLFFFSQIPENKTLITNINIRSKEFNKNINSNKNIEKINFQQEIKNTTENQDLIEKIKTYDFDLEILRNHQIYFFGKVIRYFPYMIIKIYISQNFTKNNEINQQRMIESSFYCVGKIESNFIRNEFNIYKGNDNNYEKILHINYNINLFGLFGVRSMTVNKYENNQLIISYKNELPKWDNEFKFYKLNFNGRVKMMCPKNFILKQNEENILQCGKIDDNSFALDFISPLSPFESFCISITSLVNKKACE